MKARTTIVRDVTDDHDGQIEGIRLLVIGRDSYETYDLPTAGTITLGRSENNDVQIDDAQASRTHARLTIGDTLIIEDLGSINGTRVRDRPIARGERVVIQPGETIAIGSSVVIVHVRSGFDSGPAPADSPTFSDRELGRSEVEPSDEAMRTIHHLAERAAAGTINVLILGETGVGKEVMARTVHRLSPRRDGAYVCLNCAALAENLLESELFGHERGAFTGAVGTKLGLLETAAGGTLFLDEIGEMPLGIQAKLLRVIETREVTRVGSVRPRQIDVRFVAATNLDLETEVDRGAFRRDLYFRLNGLSIRIPPLRERRSEIQPLAETFLRQVCQELRCPEPRISAQALAALQRRDWPGNIRELRNVIERAMLLCSGPEIGIEHLPEARAPRLPAPPPRRDSPDRLDLTDKFASERKNTAPPEPGHGTGSNGTGAGGAKPNGAKLTNGTTGSNGTAGSRGTRGHANSTSDAVRAREIEKQRIEEALASCAGNQSRAAKLLGMPRRTFIARLDRYQIARPKKGLQSQGETDD